MFTFATPTGPTTYHQPYIHNHNAFTPQTPSPLRTSRNANLLPAVMPSSPPSPKCWSSPALDTKSSPPAPPHTHTYTPTHLPFSSPQTHPPGKPKFAYSTLSPSPSSQLCTHTALARDRRKTLFRAGIRRRREEARFEGRGEQVLRLDFVRERREWARRLELEGDLGIEEEEEEEEEGGDGEMVPLTEEEEIEALVGRELDARGGKRASYGSDEEDYDQLFMQVIGASQELEMEGGGGMNAFGVGMRQQESPQQQQPLQWQEREGMDFICHREEMTDGGSMDLS